MDSLVIIFIISVNIHYLGRQHSPSRGQSSPNKRYSPGHTSTTPGGYTHTPTMQRSSSRDNFYTPSFSNSPLNVSLFIYHTRVLRMLFLMELFVVQSLLNLFHRYIDLTV